MATRPSRCLVLLLLAAAAALVTPAELGRSTLRRRTPLRSHLQRSSSSSSSSSGTQQRQQLCASSDIIAATTLPRCLNLRGGASLSESVSVGGMPKSLAWTILFGATGFELISTAFMHKAQGFSKPLPSLIAVIFYAASFYSFNLSLRALEISVAYAVWSAIVMALLAAIGMTVLGESVTALKIFGITSIILGTVALSLAD